MVLSHCGECPQPANFSAGRSNQNKHTMKHTINLSADDLKGTDYTRFKIEIRLDDECHNGHDDFAMTAMYRLKGHNNTYDPWDGGGCCHDDILTVRPDLKIFADLHLCDSHGRPMYTIENGYYIMTTDTKEKTIDYLRITSNEYDILKNSGDKIHFCLQLENLGILDRWQDEANKAIKLLEEMTGQIYKDSTTRPAFMPLTEEQRNDLNNKLDSGYYTPEEVEKRRKQSEEDKKNKIINDLKEDAAKQIKKIEEKLKIDIYLISIGVPRFNYIHYNHTNELVFNWNPPHDQITQDQYNNIINNIDLTQFPEAIKFKFGKNSV